MENIMVDPGVDPIFPILDPMGELIFDMDEEDEERNEVLKNDFYMERVVPRFNDRQFQTHFRSVADRFGVSKRTMWRSMNKVLNYVMEANIRYKFIVWPNEEMAAATAESFENINGFAGIIGIIDGCHIEIVPPKEHANSYYNRKKIHSLLLQGVCNDKKMFINVFSGVPGSCHDMRLLQHSDLSQKLINESSFPNDTHLIGDLAYMLLKHLIVGFKDHGNLTQRQRNFNSKLNQLRVLIEHSFALLKGRWRRLKYLETAKLNLAALFIVVACIFHNICLMHDDIPDDINIEEEIQEIIRINDIIPYEGDLRREGVRKRIIIMNHLAIDA